MSAPSSGAFAQPSQQIGVTDSEVMREREPSAQRWMFLGNTASRPTQTLGALCNPFDTHISEALAILENAIVQGEVSLQGEECVVSVCV